MSAVRRSLPDIGALTWDQSAGRACVWCKKLLTTGAVHAGIVRGRSRGHVLDTEVWACPRCDAEEPTGPAGDSATGPRVKGPV